MENKDLGKLKYSADRMDEAVAAFKSELLRLQGLLDAQTGKIREPKPYPIYALTHQTHYQNVGAPEYSSSSSQKNTPERALAHAAKVYEESKVLILDNQAICAENARIVNFLLESITNAGIPSQVQKSYTVRGRTKTEMEPAGWKYLGSRVHTVDMWPECERSYKSFQEQCVKWQQSIDAEKRKEEQEESAKRTRVETESRRIALCLKYGADPVKTEMSDMRDVLLEKNKYLRLAYFLEKNRGDWSDGPDYAERGLNGFTIETPDDQLIYDEINIHIVNWDGDGRIFRDCTWNYSRIYAEFVPAELLADFQKLGSDDE